MPFAIKRDFVLVGPIVPVVIVRKAPILVVATVTMDKRLVEMQELEKRAKEMGLDERVINKYKSV